MSNRKWFFISISNYIFNSNSIGIKRNNEIVNVLNSLDLFKNNPIPNKHTPNKEKVQQQIPVQLSQLYLDDKGASGSGPNL